MKYWTSLFLMGALNLHGWGSSPTHRFEQESPQPPHFLINEQQEWFIESSYLLLKPTLNNLDFANIVTDDEYAPVQRNLDIKVLKPDFSWNSGVRVVIGKYLPHHDHWDISTDMTYFYGSVNQTTHVNPEHKKGITPTYSMINDFVFIAADHLKGRWELNYFTWDLSLGREVGFSRAITLHPFIALRALLTYQDYSLRSTRTYTTPNQQTFFVPYKFKTHNRYWGVGPRVGFHMNYFIRKPMTILGQLSGALVYGPYRNHLTDVYDGVDDVYAVKKGKDKTVWLRGNLEGALGIGWEAWVKNQTVRIFPQFLFEGSFWWNMNRYFDVPVQFSNSHGALALMGVSFNLQIDF